jgi:hypothetical protein
VALSAPGQVTAETTFAVAEKIAQAPVPRQEKSRLMGLLGVLVGMRLPKVDLTRALERDHMIDTSSEDGVRQRSVLPCRKTQDRLGLA